MLKVVNYKLWEQVLSKQILEKIENKFLYRAIFFSWMIVFSSLVYYDMNLWYDKKIMANYGYPLYIFEL